MVHFLLTLSVVLLMSLFSFYSHAQAYIDPSTTSYIIQIVVGAVIAGGAAIGYYWRKLRKKARHEDTNVADTTAEAAPENDEFLAK